MVSENISCFTNFSDVPGNVNRFVGRGDPIDIAYLDFEKKNHKLLIVLSPEALK